MSEDQRFRVAQLFEQAVDLSAAEQLRFLQHECAGDADLLAQVKALLEADNEAEQVDFLTDSALETEAKKFATLSALSRNGQTLGRYRLLESIGEGGMGEVYLAMDTQLDRKVAVKLVRSQLTTSEVLRRFHNERQILAHLNHQNIATLLDNGMTDDGLPFFVMEFVDGIPLDRYAREASLTTSQRLELFRTVCSAVQYAHQNLVIHRDIKPGNILVTGEGVPKLLDFGIARVLAAEEETTRTLTLFRAMTPEYASPEQVKGELITTATDVYSLGVVLYELITGQSPYQLSSRKPQELVQSICATEPTRPSLASKSDASIASRLVTSDLDNIVLKAMRKEPQRRYSSVGEFSEDIRRHLNGLPVVARKDTFSYRTSKFVQRHKLGVVAAALVAFTLLAGIVTTGWEARRARLEKARAERRFSDVRRLANSFMFEFHDSIKDVPGTLQARQLLLTRALEYLDDLSREASDDDSLRSELAVSYDRLGDITFDVDQAIAIHRKSLRLNESLNHEYPKSDQYRKQLALSYDRLANLLKQKGDTVGSLDFTNKEIAVAQSLVKDFPGQVEYQSILVDAYLSLTTSLEQTGDVKSAIDYARKSIVAQQMILAAEPGNPERKRDLAVAYSFAANALEVDGNYAEALEFARKEEELEASLLANDKTNARYLRDRWTSLLKQGRLLTKSGNALAGIDYLTRALKQIVELVNADPQDKGHQRGLAKSYLQIGKTLAELNKDEEAQGSYTKAITISQTLLMSDPDKMETRTDLAQMYSARGELAARRGRSSAALADLMKARELQEAASLADPMNVRLKTQLAEIYERTGEVYIRFARSSATNWITASEWEQKSVAILDELQTGGRLAGSDGPLVDEVTRNLALCNASIALAR